MVGGLRQKDDAELTEHGVMKANVPLTASAPSVPLEHGEAISGVEQVTVLVSQGEISMEVWLTEADHRSNGRKRFGEGSWPCDVRES